ncbi:hypothetical protein SUGI_0261000 [Cryptomeria japonica]|nr:hypothetical protein SUGI_0261000 [Cryptomeria japonica]
MSVRAAGRLPFTALHAVTLQSAQDGASFTPPCPALARHHSARPLEDFPFSLVFNNFPVSACPPLGRQRRAPPFYAADKIECAFPVSQ